jgi:hypothetical protein
MPFTASIPLRSDPWRALAWAGVLLIATLLVRVWQAQRPELVLAMLVFLASTVAVQLFLRQLPSLFALMLVVAALLSAGGGVFHWFESVRWYDEAVHAYTGFAGMGAIGYLYARTRSLRRSTLVWWCTGMGLGLGIGWEVIEELVGDLEMVDTATDLVLDTLGAALGGAFAWQAVQQAGARH